MWNRLVFAILTISGCTDEGEEGWRLRDEEIGAVSSGLSKCMGGTVGASDYCAQAGCGCLAGEGDCDSNVQCDQTVQAQVCGLNNGARYGRPSGEDVCWPPHCQNGAIDGDESALDCGGSCGTICTCSTGTNGDSEFCTPSCKCSAGEGDCDSAIDCEQTPEAQICVANIGAKFGQLATNDICVPPHCVNERQDGTETGLDCGGSCGSCPSSTYGRANIDSAGNEANAEVEPGYDITPDGRFVVFATAADDLDAGDTNAAVDVYRHDRTTGETVRVSIMPNGAQAAGDCFAPSTSDDGRFVAFVSRAVNVVWDDTNGLDDVFVKDLQTRMITRVSVGAGGVEANGPSSEPHISGNGMWVAYTSAASNLVASDTNAADDVFLSTRSASSTIRASVDTSGVQADAESFAPHIDRNGRFLVFASSATNLVIGDTNGVADIFLFDRMGGTSRISRGPGGTQANQASSSPFIVGPAGYVTYRSLASNLVTGDTNGTEDLFRTNRAATVTVRLNVASDGSQANAASTVASADDSGRYVAFTSAATNLIAGDTNGVADCFLRDVTGGTTIRIDNGTAPDGQSGDPVVAGGAGFIVFRSEAANQMPGDSNGVFDLFVAPRP